jgi:putative hydrolases of HD superfamily
VDLSERDFTALAGLFSLAGRLKRLKRKGWVDRGVEDPESVSDHSFRLALMTMVLGQRRPTLDIARAVCLAIVHDLPESLTGDVTPFDDRLDDSDSGNDDLFFELPTYSDAAEHAKTEAERQAMRDMVADLPPDIRTLLLDAWEEYEAGQTPEARFVRQLDKLETWLQAVEYREAQPELVIESFRKGVERDVDDPDLATLLSLIADRDIDR